MPVVVCRDASWSWKCRLTPRGEGSGVMAGAWMALVWAACNLGLFFYLVHGFFCVSFAKSEVFHGYFFDLCCRGWSDEAWGCPAPHRDSFRAVMLKEHCLFFQCTGRFTSTWFWVSGSKNSSAVLHVSYFSVIITMWIKGLVPIKKGAAVFYSQFIISV